MRNKISILTIKKILFLSFIFCLLFVFINTQVHANPLSERLKGKILLQVEQNGEAWYVNPIDERRYFMGRPADAFDLMRKLGIGIKNSDLEKIEIANENLGGQDSDKDGLSDLLEDAIGTSKNNDDTDGDGYKDKDELIAGYNPRGAGELSKDNGFAKKQVGKILLQVEQNGEAWYVNPDNNKRYYLGRPADAFNLMRKLGLGITDKDLASIIKSGAKKIEEWDGKTICPLLVEKLDTCTPYVCEFKHPNTGELLYREVFGFDKEGECLYIEKLLNDYTVFCKYQEQQRRSVVSYYKTKDIGNFSFLVDNKLTATDSIDDKGLVNTPLDDAIDNAQCSMKIVPTDIDIRRIIKNSL